VAGGGGGIVGQVHVANFLLCHPAVADLVVGVTGGQGGVEALPAALVEALGAHEQQLAHAVERIVGPSAMSNGVLLHTLSAPGHGVVGEAHDVKWIHHDGHLRERRRPAGGWVGLDHCGPVALVGINGHDVDHPQPGGGHSRHPRP